jgi:hypothetical protein
MSPLLSTDARLASPFSFLAWRPLPGDTISAHLSGSPFTYHIPAKFRSANLSRVRSTNCSQEAVNKHAIVIKQIAIAFFLFTVNSFFSNGLVVSVVLSTTTIGALAPGQGHFQNSRGTGL